jgi:hypothetical protein
MHLFAAAAKLVVHLSDSLFQAERIVEQCADDLRHAHRDFALGGGRLHTHDCIQGAQEAVLQAVAVSDLHDGILGGRDEVFAVVMR